MKPKKTKSLYWEMTTAELREATREYDDEFLDTPGEPLSPEQSARLRKARRKRGRPRVGEGAVNVLISLERGLLRRADRLARKKGLSRSQLIAQGLLTALADSSTSGSKGSRRRRRSVRPARRARRAATRP